MYIKCIVGNSWNDILYDCLHMSHEEVIMTACHFIICDIEECIEECLEYLEAQNILNINEMANLIYDGKYEDALEFYNDHIYDRDDDFFNKSYEIIDPNITLIKKPHVPQVTKDQYLKKTVFK